MTTNIEWADATWNPTTGCRKISPGCQHCYAETQTARILRMDEARGRTDGKYAAGFDFRMHPNLLDIPARWRKPRFVFVNSMSDLFHPGIDADFLVRVWDTMLAHDRHTYLILTKRPHRMQRMIVELDLPLPPQIWLGVSAENQALAANRIPPLLSLQPAVAVVSAEPLLELVDLTPWLDRLGWVICGGESGPERRPFNPCWARSLRNQCDAFAVPFFYKQGSAYRPGQNRLLDGQRHDARPGRPELLTTEAIC